MSSLFLVYSFLGLLPQKLSSPVKPSRHLALPARLGIRTPRCRSSHHLTPLSDFSQASEAPETPNGRLHNGTITASSQLLQHNQRQLAQISNMYEQIQQFDGNMQHSSRTTAYSDHPGNVTRRMNRCPMPNSLYHPPFFLVIDEQSRRWYPGWATV